MLGFNTGALAALATAAIAAVAGQLRPGPTCTTRGCGTGQQMISTYYSNTPSSHQARTTSPPTLAMPIHLQQLQLRSFYLPKHLPTIPEEEPP